MKKSILYVCLALVPMFFFASCQKEEITIDFLIGEWEVYEAEYNDYEDGKLTDNVSEDLSDEGLWIEFEKDGDFDSNFYLGSGTYKLNEDGDKITVIVDGESRKMDIRKVSKKEIELIITYYEDGDDNKEVVILRLRKI